ncbi:MAG: 4Fe-4S double cluster binding domain-containing protein, partial [Acidobacteriota bacterium]|nr:4Fe-4S double cluster binding domain-containing protein [Acidobacteriota bacterium]
HADRCGKCTDCITACPTGAIVEPWVVDARRCISYLTIELKGPIPEELRPLVGEWIFGCDVCQDVCPWNHKSATPAPADRLEIREDLDGLDPREILALDESEFRRRYSGTALMRARWDGMRRNACVVLGNRGDRSDLGILEAAVEGDPDETVRVHAEWAVERIRSGEDETKAGSPSV